MPVTKIINVSKGDEFEEVFDLFKNTEAEDVIFIFPKGSRFTKQEQYFEVIKSEADLLGKKVSVMTADPIISQFASKYSFDILETRSTGRRRLPSISLGQAESSSLPVEPEPLAGEFSAGTDYPLSSDFGGEGGEERQEEEQKEELVEEELVSEEPETILTAARVGDELEEGGQGRMIKDIFPSRADRSLEIKEEKERAFEVDIKSRIGEPRGQVGDIEKIWAEEEKRGRKLRPPRLFKRMPLLLIISAALVLVLILFSTLGSAQVIIRPQKQKLDFKLKISASSAATAVNFDFNQVPGQQFKEQKKEAGTFPVSGQKDVVQKASGKITIFNKSSASQRLVATTRFKSPEGLIFRIPRTITVPAAVKAGVITTPGSIESVVYADRPGPEYNIGPTQFTIPGLEGTPKFNDFYAVSDKPMTGGIIGPAKVVTEGDFAKAQEELAAKIKDEIFKSLKDQGGELKIIEAVAIKFDAPEVNAKVGEAANNLQMSLEGSADTIAFRESDVVELIKNFISKKNGLELLSKDLGISYVNAVPGTDGASLSFEVKISGQAAVRLDKNAILKDIAGMNEDSVRSYIKGKKEVESVRIILSPFWVKKIPKDSERIKIEIDID